MNNEWETPIEFYRKLDNIYHFDLDPCSTVSNHKCKYFYTKREDGLLLPWFGNVFCNPPYDRSIGLWVKKAYESFLSGCNVVLLIPARTDTSWFHEYCLKGQIVFIKGRIHFNNSKNSAPFPSILVLFVH